MFCYQLEQLHSAGVPILEALQDLCDSTHNNQLKKILLAVCAEIEGGKTLSQALAMHSTTFDSVFINLIAAGEHAGKLDMVLKHLSAHYAKSVLSGSASTLSNSDYRSLAALRKK